ncbi:MAG: GNAT family N-acetyltransferase [Luteolibacter sp.]
MEIRQAEITDWKAIWKIFHSVIVDGDTYVFDPDTPEAAARSYWFAEGTSTWVATDQGEILGTYIFKANQPALGSHIANASYMVSPNARGKGVGSAMCRHSLQAAEQAGFLAMQFNIVVSTNAPAVHLWKKHGFRTIGTIPKGYRHRQLGLVDALIMFRELE